jgi:hypothetical protein
MAKRIPIPRQEGHLVWAIDPGNLICGMAQLNSDGSIGVCFDEETGSVYRRILSLCGDNPFKIAIEDVYPYSMRLTPEIIDTCKVIGELAYRFRKCKQCELLSLVPRNTIKKWIFDTFPEVCIPRIEKKMALLHARKVREGKRGLMKKDGTMFLPSFQYVDDRIVKESIKTLFNIPTPKPGKPSILGITRDAHAWQALAVAAFFISNNDNKKSDNQ